MKKIDILFIIPPFHLRNGSGSLFPLGIGYLISDIEKKEYTWDIINCSEMIHSFYNEDLDEMEVSLIKAISEYKPIVIGIGPCVTPQLKALIRIANVCKTELPEVPVFAGGPFASIQGQEVVFKKFIGIDYLVKGDGENAVADVINTVKSGKEIGSSRFVSSTEKTYVNYINEIDLLSFPYRPQLNKDVFSKRRIDDGEQYTMIASRGCLYKCSYCVSGHMKNERIPFRKRTPKNIIEEMVFLRDNYNASSIVFYDDLFFSSFDDLNGEVENFCKMLKDKNVNMNWQIEMRPDYLTLLTEEVIKLLRDSGCIQINVGVEKKSKNGLAFLGKKVNVDDLISKMHIVRRIGIKLSATFILGGKDETEEDVIENIEYAKSLPLEYAHFNPLFIYPGTDLYEEVFSSPEDWAKKVLEDKRPWGEVVFENDDLSSDKLIELVNYAYNEFYKGTELSNDPMVWDRFNLMGKGE